MLAASLGCAERVMGERPALLQDVLPFLERDDAIVLLEEAAAMPDLADKLLADLEGAPANLAEFGVDHPRAEPAGALLPTRLPLVDEVRWKVRMAAVVALCARYGRSPAADSSETEGLLRVLGRETSVAAHTAPTAVRAALASFKREVARPEVLAALVKGMAQGPFVGEAAAPPSPNADTSALAFAGLRLEVVNVPDGGVVLVMQQADRVLWRRKLSANSGIIESARAATVRELGDLGWVATLDVVWTFGRETARVYIGPDGGLLFYVVTV